MVDQHAPDADRVREGIERVREEVGAGPEILVATKYVTVEGMGELAEAGVSLVGENRLQDLAEKQERWGNAFTWDFIGTVQSRKAADIAGRVRLVHAIGSESALAKLEGLADQVAEVLVQVNVAGELGKAGIPPGGLEGFIERCPVPVSGLMTMPPLARDPEESRPHFARLAQLAGEHGLSRLSMGTSQDYLVAAEEGATIIRLGSAVFG